jgi:hypothetical protein
LKFKALIVAIVFSVVLSIFFGHVILATLEANAQQQQQLQPNTNTSSLGVKITSPAKGQQVPIGGLTISGTSTDDPVDNCQVSIILNGVKPYQETNATGPGSEPGKATDYSTWKYTFTPSYAVIKEGVNKITSKISCTPSKPTSVASLAKWYSVNVTGVANTKMLQQGQASLPSNTTTAATIAPIQKENTVSSKKTISTTTQKINSAPAAPTAIPSIPYKTLGNNNPKILTLSADFATDPIIRGSEQTILFQVSDATSKEKVGGAKVVGKVTSMSGDVVKESFAGSTDDNGQVSYSWKIGENGKASKYRVIAQASAMGYQDASSATVFNVKPATTTAAASANVDTNNLDQNQNSNSQDSMGNNINDFTQRIIQGVNNMIRNSR